MKPTDSHPPVDYDTPEAAEQAFYAAFAKADPLHMMTVWEDSDVIACIHPLGPRLTGRDSVQASWRQIFGSGVRLRFHAASPHQVMLGETLALRVVYEHITVLGEERQPTQPLIATNAYRRSEGGWRLVLHHASPGQPDQGEPVPARSGALH